MCEEGSLGGQRERTEGIRKEGKVVGGWDIDGMANVVHQKARLVVRLAQERLGTIPPSL